MDPKDPAVSRLRITVATLAERADAHCAALFVPRQSGLFLVVQNEVNQLALDIAHSTWARRRSELEAGGTVRYGKSVVWPLFDGPKLVALLYFDHAPSDFPDDDARALAQEVVRRVARLTPQSPVSNYIALGLSLADARAETERDQLAMALHLSGGKVRAAARLLGVTRETIYRRAERLGVDLDEYRRGRRADSA